MGNVFNLIATTKFRNVWLCLLALFSCTLLGGRLFAQSIDLPAFFSPSIRVGGIFTPTIAINDSTKYGMYKTRFSALIPLKSNVKVELLKLNASVSQDFLNIHAGYRYTQFSPIGDKATYNFTIGYTRLSASIQNGFWFFHARGGYEWSGNNNDPATYHAMAAGARVYVKGINKANILGLGCIYNGRLLPFPIVGIRRPIGENLSLTAILPVMLDLSYKVNSNLAIDFKNSFTAAETGFVIDTNSLSGKYKTDKLFLHNYNLQTSLLAACKVSKKLQIYAEGGVYPILLLRVNPGDTQKAMLNYKYYGGPFFSVTIRYSLGSFLVNSQIFGTDE